MLKYDLPAFSRLSLPATIPSSSENQILDNLKYNWKAKTINKDPYNKQ